jgi:peptidoglycan hydrolase-like protein with peptidoglycan-binding domain
MASAGWHGRAIQDPEGQGRTAAAAPDSFPAGWSAGPVRMGTGLRHEGGSDRVREVQRRLWDLGYRPGPVDGIFGPRTRAAVQWFQIKHGFRPDGVVELATLTHLRERTSAARAGAATPAAGPTREPARSARPAGATPPQPVSRAAGGSQTPAGDDGDAIAPERVLLFVVLLLAAPALVLIALRRKPPKQRRPAVLRKVPGGPARHSRAAARPSPAAAAPEQSSVIGYVRGGDRAELARHAGAIRRACASRGWALGHLLRDDQPGAARTHERPGLATALERLSAPGPSRLVLSRLSHLSRSASDLTALFEWFGRHQVEVVAMDVGLDTTTARGKRAAESLLAAIALRQAQLRSNGGNGASVGKGTASNGNGNGNGKSDRVDDERKVTAGGSGSSGVRGDPG